jgi:hypothetical protein
MGKECKVTTQECRVRKDHCNAATTFFALRYVTKVFVTSSLTTEMSLRSLDLLIRFTSIIRS